MMVTILYSFKSLYRIYLKLNSIKNIKELKQRSQQQRNLTNVGENARGVITMWNDDIYSNQRKGTLQNIKKRR